MKNKQSLFSVCINRTLPSGQGIPVTFNYEKPGKVVVLYIPKVTNGVEEDWDNAQIAYVFSDGTHANRSLKEDAELWHIPTAAINEAVIEAKKYYRERDNDGE